MSAPTRRSLVVAAVILFGSIALGVGVTAIFADPGDPPAEESAPGDPPSIIVKPNTGTAPADSGDRGGWAQLVLFGAIVAGLALIAVVALRGTSAKARAGREEWKRAAESGRDGAVG